VSGRLMKLLKVIGIIAIDYLRFVFATKTSLEGRISSLAKSTFDLSSVIVFDSPIIRKV
jgi:hypothetical protein